jgi:hypothetical protein
MAERNDVHRSKARSKSFLSAASALGHFGVRRTHSMLRNQYWWTGMYQQVATYVSRCEVCDRVRSNFNTLSPQLQPLPIMGLEYVGLWILPNRLLSLHVGQIMYL